MRQQHERDLLQQIDWLTALLSIAVAVLLVILYFSLASLTGLDSHFREFALGIILNLIPILLVFDVSYFLFRRIQTLRADQQKDELVEELSDRVESKISAAIPPKGDVIPPPKIIIKELIVQNTETGKAYLVDRNGFLHPFSDQDGLLYFAEMLGYQPDQLPAIPAGESRAFGPEVTPPRKWRPPKTPEEEFESQVSWNLQYIGKEPGLQDNKTVFTFTFRNDNDREVLVHSARLSFLHGAPLGISDICAQNKPNTRGVLQVSLLFDDGKEAGSMVPGKQCTLNLVLTRRLTEKDEKAIQGLTIGFIEITGTYSGKPVTLHIPQV